MKRFILCADDYGQNTAISQAIIELFKKNRLSATSCLTNSFYWLDHAKWLNPFKDLHDIGLHTNLTEGKPLTKETEFLPLGSLIIKAYLRQLNKETIKAEINAQIDQFVAGMGRLPDFIDGHQHVHQFPVVREALLEVYESRLHQSGCYVRSIWNPRVIGLFQRSGYLKMLLIQFLGSLALKNALTKRNIPFNTSFSGSYDFKDAEKYATLFPKFLEEIGSGGLVMCHPGYESSIQEDSIASSRPFEYQFLQSDQFADLCAKEQITLSRFKDHVE